LKPVGVLTIAIIAGLSGIFWLVVVFGPQASFPPESDLFSFFVFMGAWAAGMAAMMLPSTVPMVSLMARTGTDGGMGLSREVGDPAQFLIGYLGIWSAVGVLAFYGSLAIGYIFPLAGSNAAAGLTKGGLVFIAGAYQFTPIKQKALQGCRSPATFLMTSWRTGTLGRVAMGAEYSVYCTSCCWAIMAILVLVGAMSLPWMVFFAGVIFVERVGPRGVDFSRAFGALLMVSGAAIAGLVFY
jgi:predicted metal-binding membrane protein